MMVAVRTTAGAFVAVFGITALLAVLYAAPTAPLTVVASVLGIPLAWLAAPSIVHAARQRFVVVHRAERCRTILAAVPEEWLRLATGTDVDDLSLPARRAQQLVAQYVAGMPGEMVGVRV